MELPTPDIIKASRFPSGRLTRLLACPLASIPLPPSNSLGRVATMPRSTPRSPGQAAPKQRFVG
jgi:hypothetical protein